MCAIRHCRLRLFLIQSQLNAAKGDATTSLPPALEPPPHWPEAR